MYPVNPDVDTKLNQILDGQSDFRNDYRESQGLILDVLEIIVEDRAWFAREHAQRARANLERARQNLSRLDLQVLKPQRLARPERGQGQTP